MRSFEPGNKKPVEQVEAALHRTARLFTQMIAKSLQGIEEMGGAGKAVTGLPEGIIDVGAYFLLQEPGQEGYSLQVNKKHLLRGVNDNKSGTEVIRYMSSTDKHYIRQKVIRLRLLHDLLCENTANIGFSQTMKHNYQVLNHFNNGEMDSCPSEHSTFMRELLRLIHNIYQDNLEELYDDMAIIRRSVMHRGGAYSDPYEYYTEGSRDFKNIIQQAQSNDLPQHIEKKKILLILMDEIKGYPFKSIKNKYAEQGQYFFSNGQSVKRVSFWAA